ncbi:MAG: hypothetical protein ITG02_12920, partial [Patulibacter sp.]|nr:hypothetical protein [Patulibacter sp.]
MLVGTTTLGGAVLAPAAGAADPGEAAPEKTTLAASGLRASWSAADGAASVDPGQRFTVRVRASKDAARKARVRITATRAAGDAGPRRVVRRTLRKG